jgi:hypothetical protein
MPATRRLLLTSKLSGSCKQLLVMSPVLWVELLAPVQEFALVMHQQADLWA